MGFVPWQLGQRAHTGDYSQSLLATLCQPEQLSGHHTTLGHAIRFPLFIHPSARLILRLGYVRTYVWRYCIEIGGTDGRILPQGNTEAR